MKKNLNWVTQADEDLYPSAHEKKYCRDLQDEHLSVLEMVSIYQKTDEMYSLGGYLTKWNLRCYPNLPLHVAGDTELEPPSGIPEEAHSLAASSVSNATMKTGPPAVARPLREYAEQPDEEMWTDDAGHVWWPGHHRFRQALPISAALLTDDKQFICPQAYPNIQTGITNCPDLCERLQLEEGTMVYLYQCSPLQQSWLLAKKARFGWSDSLLIEWIKLGQLASQYPKLFPAEKRWRSTTTRRLC